MAIAISLPSPRTAKSRASVPSLITSRVHLLPSNKFQTRAEQSQEHEYKVLVVGENFTDDTGPS